MKLFGFISGLNSIFFGLSPYITIHILEQGIPKFDCWCKKDYKYHGFRFGIVIFGLWIELIIENITT